ncbi:MAG TPA: family 78 glycoside hydrolase catalytic domain [Planctomycetota bacterium]|nr:family 78 glycoside hydrolase catalytic domain [Planctomycetota bacterium]
MAVTRTRAKVSKVLKTQPPVLRPAGAPEAQQPIPAIITEATWIWPLNSNWDMYNCYALFRKSFDLKSVPNAAPLFITADQSYQLFINGRFVCRGPVRGFQSHWPYDEVNVAQYLRKGKNLIAVRAHNPGFSNFQYITQGVAGLLVAARWGDCKLVSGWDWKCRRQDGVSKNTVPTSMQLFCQEHIDKRIEPDDWMMPKFDDSKWGNSVGVGRWNAMPWYTLEHRMIPLLREERIYAKTLLGQGEGKCNAGFRDTRDVTKFRHGEDRSHKPASGSPRVVRVQATGKGRFRSILLDFGRTVVGALHLKVSGAKGGEIIDTLHTENIDAATLTPSLLPDAWCRMSFGYRMTCRKGENVHDFYHIYGFRYLTLTVRDTAAPLTIEVALNWVGYPLKRNGGFYSSDDTLNKIWETCAWTQQCCSLDAYVDTPWREQAQWWGDARVQGWNTFHLDGDARLFRRGIHCIAGQTTPEGLTYGHAPTMAHSCILPDFTLIWMLTIWDYYWQTGSIEPLVTHEKTIAGALEYFRTHTDAKTGMVGYDPRYWLFLDWTDIFKDGYPTVLNAWLLMALESLAKMFVVAGNRKKAAELSAWAKRVRRALERLINKDGLMRDGYKWDRSPVQSTCVHSQALAIMSKIIEPKMIDGHGEHPAFQQVLIPFIREHQKPKVYPSAYWITYVFSVLSEYGYAKDVLRFIRNHWEPMIAHGTTFENFNPEPGNWSHSHAWSAHPLFHLMQTIGGIHQTAPAWREVKFAPVFQGERGGAVVPTPTGPIVSVWERTRGGVDVSLELPKGTRGVACLPGQRTQAVTGSRRWLLPL